VSAAQSRYCRHQHSPWAIHVHLGRRPHVLTSGSVSGRIDNVQRTDTREPTTCSWTPWGSSAPHANA
jgi:hypothetical protein